MSDNTYSLRKLSRPAKSRNGVMLPAASNQGGDTNAYFSILEQKLDKAVFDELLEKVTIEGETFIKAKYSFFSVGSVAGYGPDGSGSGGSGGGGYGLMREWPANNPGSSTLMALGANLGFELRDRVAALENGSAGLDETQLAEYLSANGYATEDWVTGKGYALNSALSSHTGNTTMHITEAERAAWNNKVDKVAGKGLSANDFTDALLSKLNGIAAGANNYSHPTGGANTTIAAATGKVLSSITVNTLGHVTAVGSKTLAEADIPTLSIGKISGLQSAIDSKLSIETFEGLFKLVTIDGKTYIKALHSFFSVGSNSGYGPGEGPSGGGGGSSYGLMQEWSQYNVSTANTMVLSAALGYELQSRVTTIEGSYVDRTSAASTYAVKNQNPEVDLNTVNGMGIMCNPSNDYATTARHYPTDEAGTLFYGNAAYSSANQIYGTYLTNRWFVRGGGQGPASKTAWKELAFKSDIPSLANYVDKTSAQEISGVKTFTSPLTANSFIKSGGTASQFLKADGSVDSNSYALASALGGYLPLSGGTLTNYLTINTVGKTDTPLRLNSNSDGCYIGMIANGTSHGYYGAVASGPVWYKNGVNNTLWHSGNDGSGSGLDADLLDGEHNGSVTAKSLRDPDFHDQSHRRTSADINFANDAGLHYFLATSQMTKGKPSNDSHIIHAEWDNNSSGASQIAMPATGGGNIEFRQQVGQTWMPWKALAFVTDNVASATNADKLDGYHEAHFFRYRGEIPKAYIDITDYKAGAAGYANYLSGTYYISMGDHEQLFVNFARNAGSTSALQFKTSFNNNAYLFFRKTVEANRVTPWTAILTELNIGSFNAGSATKLADNTAFTAWGQTFFENGKPKEVSGNLTGVGSITASGNITTRASGTNSALVRAFNGNGGVVLEITYNRGLFAYAADSTYIGCIIGYNGTNTFLNLGNVGIGTTAPAYKLDVNGTIRGTKVMVGSIVLEDVGNGQLKINGSVYSTGSMSGLGPAQ